MDVGIHVGAAVGVAMYAGVVCLCVCLCIRMYIYKHMYTYMYIYVHICIYTYINIYVYIHIHIAIISLPTVMRLVKPEDGVLEPLHAPTGNKTRARKVPETDRHRLTKKFKTAVKDNE